MGFDGDLFVPFRPGGVCFVATSAVAKRENFQFYIGIINMCLTSPMAPLTGKTFMLKFCQFLDLVRMTLFAGFLASISRCSGSNLTQCFTSIPSILSERTRRQKVTGHGVGDYDSQRE